MFERLRWPTILIPALVVAGIELLNDTLLDEYLPFPWDTVVVIIVVLALSFAFWRLAFGRWRALAVVLAQRNAELEERNRTSRALHRVSVAIAALAGVDQVLQAVVDQARALLSADVSVLVLADPTGELTVRAWSGPPGSVDVRRTGAEPLSAVDPRLVQVQLATPLQRAGQTIGQLYVASARPRSFDVDDVETLSSLANQAAVAIENERLQARLRELAVVSERERIAREMHDGLAQVLGYVNTKSQAVETLLEAGRLAEARTQLAELAAAARSVYVDVREAILGLRSPIHPEIGLVGAIEEYAARFADASKLAVVVEASPWSRAISLAPDVEAQLFRIVQESLTNVRKHAAAGRVVLGIGVADERLTITVADDGRGVTDPAARNVGWPHYGMDAIRERADAIGATVSWDAAAASGEGTIVRVVLPLVRGPIGEAGLPDATGPEPAARVGQGAAAGDGSDR